MKPLTSAEYQAWGILCLCLRWLLAKPQCIILNFQGPHRCDQSDSTSVFGA